MSATTINRLVRRVRVQLEQADELLATLTQAGVTKWHVIYANLDVASWTLRAALAAHQVETMRRLNPANQAPAPAAGDSERALALTEPLADVRKAATEARRWLTRRQAGATKGEQGTMPIDLNLIVQRGRAFITQARETLADLENAGVGQGDAVHDDLATAIWTLEQTLAAYQQGTLAVADPATPDTIPADQDMAVAMALNRPLDGLKAAVAAAEERLSV